jgi:hypothetical protein
MTVDQQSDFRYRQIVVFLSPAHENKISIIPVCNILIKETTLYCDSSYKQTCDLYNLVLFRSLQLLNLRLVVKLKLQVLLVLSIATFRIMEISAQNLRGVLLLLVSVYIKKN